VRRNVIHQTKGKAMLRAILLTLARVLTLSAVPVAADTWDGAEAAYERGDYETAARLFLPLAEQGDAAAQYNLGVMYGKGQGVPRDDVLAYMWFNLAAAQGDPNGKGLRDLVAKSMTREQIAEAQKLAREWKPK
jgi:TPR repeat protein